MTFRLQSLDASSPRTTTWKVQYAIGVTPSTFTDLTTNLTVLTTGGLTFTDTTVSVNFGSLLNNLSSPVWIRIVTLTASTGSGNRPTTAIDDVNLTWTNGIISTSPNVTTGIITSITSNSAICSGNVTSDGGSSIIERGICYGPAANPNITGTKVTSTTATIGAYTCSLTTLYHSTLHHVRAYATNAIGICYGSDSTFTTLNNPSFVFWADYFSTPANWIVTTIPGTIGSWAIIPDTMHASTAWRNFWGANYMDSPTINQGIAYFDGIYQFMNNIQGTENSMITTSNPINCSSYSNVNIRFFQTYYSFNADSTLIEVSTDNTNWHTIMANPSITANGNANTWVHGLKEISLTQWAANQPQVWIRFRFFAPAIAGTPPSTTFGRGYGWMIDDVSLYVPNNNNIQVDRVTLHDGYTQIPSGLGLPMYYDGDFTNLGGTQTHFKLHGIDLTTNSDSTSNDLTLLPGQSVTNLALNGYFFIPPTTLGTYKITSYLSSDAIPRVSLDTIGINVVCDTCMYSRDNNTYTGSRWAGTTGTTSDPYTAVNKFEVNQNRMAYGVNCVVAKGTKSGSKIKAVLYKFNSGVGTRTVVAQSTNYYVTTSDISTTTPMFNPPSISLPFTTGYTMQKDSMYWVGILVYGGTDTVKMATDNTGIPQWEQTSLFFDPASNSWYIWESGNVPAVMIRTVFNQNEHWSSPLPASAGIISGMTPVCQGQNSVTYTVPIITNASSYIWTLPTGAVGNSSTNSITINYSNLAVSGNITVKGSNSFGYGAISTLLVLVNPLPSNAGSIAGTQDICQGTSAVNYSIPLIPNATIYSWFLPSGATGTSNTNSITVNYGSNSLSGNITVKGQNTCGFGDSAIIFINVNSAIPANASTISGQINVCQGQSLVNYNIPVINNATSYIWTLPTGATGTSSTNNIIVNYGSNAQAGNITVKGHNACGDGTASSLGITINPLPVNTGIISGDSIVCQEQNAVTYTIPYIANATSYIWTLPGGATGTSDSNSITVNYAYTAISGYITVKAHNSCGNSALASLPINIKPSPLISFTTNPIVPITGCEPLSIVFTNSSAPSNSSYVWDFGDGQTSTMESPTHVFSAGNYAISLTATTIYGCFKTLLSYPNFIVIHPIPTTPIITQNANTLSSSANNGNQWFNLSTGIINNATAQTYLPQQIGDYFTIVTLNGCSSDSSNIIHYDDTGIDVNENNQTIKVYPNPVQNELIIESKGVNEKINFEIINSIGQIIFKGKLIEKAIVQTANFTSGVYLIKLETGKIYEFKKIVKE